jgi:ribosomal protein S3
MGAIGCKVWINRGEIFGKGLNGQITPPKPTLDSRGPRRPFNRDNKKGAK